MTDLRLTGKSEDGTHLSLVDGDGNSFALRISDTLRATINQPRLASVPVSSETISVKDIQRRLRAGESFEQVAREGATTVEKVERFSGPIMQEREYILDRARELVMRKDAYRSDMTFADVVSAKLTPRGVDADEITWNTWRLPDGIWHIELHFPNRDGSGVATWSFDMARRALSATDSNGAWLIDEDAPTRTVATGLIHTEPNHPSRYEEPVSQRTLPQSSLSRITDALDSLDSPEIPEAKIETPRLAVIRETPTAADSVDGITARAKVPSWDEIMFGRKAEDADETDVDREN
jgi:hypothetical protein